MASLRKVIRNIILAIVAIVGTISFVIFFTSINFFDISSAQSNFASTFNELINMLSPVDIGWIQAIISFSSNPFILIVIVVFLGWVFWPSKKEEKKES